MKQSLLKITFIIFANLLAFIGVWLILDALFKADWVILLACVLISMPVLWLIMYFKAGKILEELHNIKEK